MSEQINAIFVDDKPANISALASRFRLAFESMGFTLSISPFYDVDDALAALKNSPAVGLLVVDLLYVRSDLGDNTPAQDEPRGFDLIEVARTQSDQTYILAISTNNDSRANLLQDALSRGANYALLRSYLSVDSKLDSPSAIAFRVVNQLRLNGVLSTLPINSVASDRHMEALKNELGTPVLSELYREATKIEASVTISSFSLSGGRSGARVCVMSHEIELNNALPRLVKFSRDRALLEREVRLGRDAHALSQDRWVVRSESVEPIGPKDGWFCIVSKLAKNAVSLREWLLDPELANDVMIRVVGSLIGEGVSEFHASPTSQTSNGDPYPGIPVYRQNLIWQACDLLLPCMGRINAQALPSSEDLRRLLRNFCEDGKVGDISPKDLPQRRWRVYSHGDLHCGNVLVYSGRSPSAVMIDWSEFGLRDWTTDVSRIHVDVLLRGINSSTDSMFWDSLMLWRAAISSVSSLSSSNFDIVVNEEIMNNFRVASWITSNLSEFAAPSALGAPESEYLWQWHLALAAEFLRGSYQEDMAPPVRFAALLAAYDQISIAETLVC